MASGKTWCANHLVTNHGYKKVAFTDELKRIAFELFGIKEKTAETRKVYQMLGDINGTLKQVDPDVWVKLALHKVQEIETWRTIKLENNTITGYPPMMPVVIDDLRYVREYEALKDNGFKFVLVTVPEAVRQQRINSLYPDTPAEAHAHESEQEWVRIPYDLVVDSTGWEAARQLSAALESQKILAR